MRRGLRGEPDRHNRGAHTWSRHKRTRDRTRAPHLLPWLLLLKVMLMQGVVADCGGGVP